jgi:hypothetical protein
MADAENICKAVYGVGVWADTRMWVGRRVRTVELAIIERCGVWQRGSAMDLGCQFFQRAPNSLEEKTWPARSESHTPVRCFLRAFLVPSTKLVPTMVLLSSQLTLITSCIPSLRIKGMVFTINIANHSREPLDPCRTKAIDNNRPSLPIHCGSAPPPISRTHWSPKSWNGTTLTNIGTFTDKTHLGTERASSLAVSST